MSVLDLFKLEDHVAVVTGAGKGIGRGIAIALAEAGADIVLASRSENELKKVAEEIESLGRKALVVTTDVTDTKSMENLGHKQLINLVNYQYGLIMPEVFLMGRRDT